MSGWTKGEWTTGPTTGRNTKLKGTMYLLRSDGALLAGVCAWADDYSAEARANAHLIAAAPDLYEALEVCANWIDDEAEKPYTRGFDSLMLMIRAALAKARGEA